MTFLFRQVPSLLLVVTGVSVDSGTCWWSSALEPVGLEKLVSRDLLIFCLTFSTMFQENLNCTVFHKQIENQEKYLVILEDICKN